MPENFFFNSSLSKGDLTYLQRSADAQKWIVGFSHDNKSYDICMMSCQAIGIFICTRPELNAYALASMKPLHLPRAMD